MITKWLKMGVIGIVSLGLLGGLIFGKDVVSYVKSSAKSVRTVVKDSVPIEFELKRARDLLEDIIPEMQANIRLIAEDEVEVASLKGEISKSRENLDQERTKIKTLRDSLEVHQASYTFGNRQYSRDDVKADLASRFERLKEGEMVLTSKERLLTSRENSLNAATQLLEKTKARKRVLENKIETLASQYRLVKASAVGSKVQFDNGKLAQTEKLIAQIQKRLDVAERVLAHESQFMDEIPVDTVREADLVAQVDEYFQDREAPTQDQTAAVAMSADPESSR